MALDLIEISRDELFKISSQISEDYSVREKDVKCRGNAITVVPSQIIALEIFENLLLKERSLNKSLRAKKYKYFGFLFVKKIKAKKAKIKAAQEEMKLFTEVYLYSTISSKDLKANLFVTEDMKKAIKFRGAPEREDSPEWDKMEQEITKYLKK